MYTSNFSGLNINKLNMDLKNN